MNSLNNFALSLICFTGSTLTRNVKRYVNCIMTNYYRYWVSYRHNMQKAGVP